MGKKVKKLRVRSEAWHVRHRRKVKASKRGQERAAKHAAKLAEAEAVAKKGAEATP